MLQPTEAEINGHRYQIGILDVPTQWRISRRIQQGLMVLERQRTANAEMQPPPEADGEEAQQSFTDLAPEAKKIMVRIFVRQALVELSDSDSEYVMSTCLRVCRRWDERAGGGTWRPVLASGGTGIVLRDGDIDLNEMLSIVLQVVEHNLASFFFGGEVQ